MEGLPGKEHLENLPLRAIVAFAARSARRVLSPSHSPDPQPESVREVSEIEVLISHAEDFAANRPRPSEKSRQRHSGELKISELSRDQTNQLCARGCPRSAEAASAAIEANGQAVIASAVETASHAAIVVPESVVFMYADLKLLKDMRLGKFPDVGKPIERRLQDRSVHWTPRGGSCGGVGGWRRTCCTRSRTSSSIVTSSMPTGRACSPTLGRPEVARSPNGSPGINRQVLALLSVAWETRILGVSRFGGFSRR